MNWFKRLFSPTESPRSSTAKINASPVAPKMKSSPAELRGRYGSTTKDALHLRATRSGIFSQLGGLPRLPSEFVWPEWNGKPQAFLAQIDLAEAHQRLASFLPNQGALYFFYDQDQSVWGFDPKDAEGWRVLYYEGDISGLKEREAPRGDAGCVFRQTPVQLQRIAVFPDSQRLPKDTFDWDSDGDAYFELQSEPFGDAPLHQLLGYPRPVQGDDMELECQLASNGVYVGSPEGYKDKRRGALESGAKDWRLLLQIDTDDDIGWMWGDAGTLYFWIREEDARCRNFDRVWMAFQCS